MAAAELERARAFLRAHCVWDNHACMPLRPQDTSFLPQLARAKAAGFAAVSLNIGFGETGPAEHIAMLAAFRRWVTERADQYTLIQRPGDVARAHADGRLGISFDIEGARGIGDDLNLVQLYYDLGVRWMLIAYNRANLAGSGIYDEVDEGLTPFGRAMIAEMNRVGMTVCCSHTGHRTAREAMAASSQPVIFSHSNCAAIHAHARNIGDDLIRECAAQGGVVGINGLRAFLGLPGTDLVDAIVRHIDHAVQLVGPAHVGIALDHVYDQQELLEYLRTMAHSFPEGLAGGIEMIAPEQLLDIVVALFARGYAEADVGMLLGGSWQRIAEINWRA